MKKVIKGVRMTVGLDLGDRFSHMVVLDGEGQVVEEGRWGRQRRRCGSVFPGLLRCG